METRIGDCPLGAKCEDLKIEQGKPVLIRCPWYIQIRGTDPNTGKELGEWGCAIAWAPTLLINTANEARKGAAATESFRNEMARQNEQTQNALFALTLKGATNRHTQIGQVGIINGKGEEIS